MYGGGISTYCWEAGLAWSISGHDVQVFTRATPDQHSTVQEHVRERFSVVRVPIRANPEFEAALGYWHLMSYCLAEEVIKSIRKYGKAPDMIEVQDYGAVGYFLLKRKLLGTPELADVKIVVYLHTPVFELAGINQEPKFLFPNYWLGQCEKFCLRAADGVLSPSRFLADKVSSIAGREIDIVPYPYFGESDQGITEHESLAKESQFDCIYLGRLEYRKGVVHLLEAMKRVWDSGKPIRLRMIGGDTQWAPRQSSMKEYIEKKYSTYISEGLLTLSAAVPPEELPSVFRSGRIVIIPSIYENFPYVCMQAMDLAKAVLVSCSGGQAEMVGSDESCGFVFDWKIEGDFQTKLLRLTAMTSKQLEEIGRNARQRIREYCSVESFVSLRLEHLRKIQSDARARCIYPFLVSVVSAHDQCEKEDIKDPDLVKGRISIVIPFYNLADYLPETIRSVQQSTYQDIEIIVVNDGSNDAKALQLLNELRGSGQGLRVLDIENGGLANARNVGAKAATGEFVAFLDADDCVEPDYYRQCVYLLNRYQNASFVYSWVRYFGQSNAIWINFDTELPYMLAGNMLAAFQVVRTADFLGYGLNDREMMFGMEDYEAWLRMVGHGKLGISIPDTLVRYRVREDSMARQFRRSTVLYLYELMAQKNSWLYEKYGAELFMLINANGPGYLWNNPTLTYPVLGYITSLDQSTVSAGDIASGQLSIGELMRLKQLASHPIVARVIKKLLSLRIDKWFKPQTK